MSDIKTPSPVKGDADSATSESAKGKPRRLTTLERMREEGEAIIKSLGGSGEVEGRRRTRSSLKSPSTQTAAAPATPAKKARTPAGGGSAKSRRGRPKKESESETEKMETEDSQDELEKSTNDKDKTSPEKTNSTDEKTTTKLDAEDSDKVKAAEKLESKSDNADVEKKSGETVLVAEKETNDSKSDSEKDATEGSIAEPDTKGEAKSTLSKSDETPVAESKNDIDTADQENSAVDEVVDGEEKTIRTENCTEKDAEPEKKSESTEVAPLNSSELIATQ